MKQIPIPRRVHTPLVLSLVAIAAVLVIAGCGGSSSSSSSESSTAESTGGSEAKSGSAPIRVALAEAATVNLAVEVADEDGTFEEEGLEVEVQTPSIPFSQLPAALGKQFDIVVGTQPGLISAAGSGIDIVADSGLQRDNPKDPGAALIVPADSSITSVKDLSGKTVGAPSTVGNNFSSLECWARKEGVDPSSIRGLEAPTPQIPELLEAGRFESALLFEPLLAGMVQGGDKNLGNAYEKCFGESEQYTSLWLSEGSWAEEHKAEIGKFLAALNKAKKSIAADPERARQLYIKNSGLPPEAAEATPIIPQEFDFSQGETIVENVEQWVEVMEENGTFKGSVEPSALVLEP